MRYNTRAKLRRAAEQKKGRRSVKAGGPVIGHRCPIGRKACQNPAHGLLIPLWLNDALMAGRCRALLAIVDAVRLQHVIERQAVGDALGADFQRPRCECFDLAVSEAGASAIILERGEAAEIPQYLRVAVLRSMLEPDKCADVCDALPDGRFDPRRAPSLPNAGLSWCKRRRLLRRHERQRPR